MKIPPCWPSFSTTHWCHPLGSDSSYKTAPRLIFFWFQYLELFVSDTKTQCSKSIFSFGSEVCHFLNILPLNLFYMSFGSSSSFQPAWFIQMCKSDSQVTWRQTQLYARDNYSRVIKMIYGLPNYTQNVTLHFLICLVLPLSVKRNCLLG